LVLLSCIPSEERSRNIPGDLLSIDSFQDQTHRVSAIVVRVSQADWELKDVERLANSVVEMLPIRKDLVSRAVETIQRDIMDSSVTDAFLLKLFNLLPRDQWTDRQMIVGELNRSVARRKSSLSA
jgi:hypothetical protein